MSIIDKINEHLTIDEILRLLPDLKKDGSGYSGMCPTGHDSQSGTSFKVNTLSPNFHCFNCNVSGSYIHLVELINHGVSSSGQGGTDTFKRTLRMLAEQYGLTDDTRDSKADGVFELIEYAMAEYHRQLRAIGNSLYHHLESKYGLEAEFVDAEKIGYGSKCPSDEMIGRWTKDDLLASGLFNPSEKSRTGVFHIYENRIIFPYNIDGRARYTIGRATNLTKKWADGKTPPKYFKQYVMNERRPYVSSAVKNQIVRCNRNLEDVIITEGITDYLSAKMHGYNAVSAVTTSFKREEYENVVAFCKTFKRVYMANDNDRNGAGQKGAARMCEMLMAAGIEPIIITLPRDDETESMDLAEYLKSNGNKGLDALMQSSPRYIKSVIESIDPDIDKRDLIDALDGVIQLLSCASEGGSDAYIKGTIKDRFGLTGFKGIIKDITAEVNARRKGSATPGHDEIFKDDHTPIKLISSGQDFVDGVLYYTATKPGVVTNKNGETKIINHPYLIGSNNTAFEIKDYQIINETMGFSRALSPQDRFESWTFSGSKYSIESFIRGNETVCAGELFMELKDFISRYVYFKSDQEPAFLATALMTFPIFMVFKAIGYIHLWAEKRSGKTTVLEILSLLGFNSMMSSSISPAAMYRSIETRRGLLLIDEAENLNPSPKARENAPSEKLELLKSGYKRSGTAVRCEGKDNDVVTYHNYSPKVFSGTKSLDSVLADRTILIKMKRAPEGARIEELIESNIEKDAINLKDKLYFYGMQDAHKVRRMYDVSLNEHKAALGEHGVQFREKELWAPYLATALHIDAQDSSLNVFPTLLKMARDAIQIKSAFDRDSKNIEIVELFYLWVKGIQDGGLNNMSFGRVDKSLEEIGITDGIILSSKGVKTEFITSVLKSSEYIEEFNWVTFQKLKGILMNFHVIEPRHELKRYLLNGTRRDCLVIDPIRTLRSLKTYKSNLDEEVLADIHSLNGQLTEEVTPF